MQALFQPQHFAELANYLLLASRRRFAADGAIQMQAAAEGVAERARDGDHNTDADDDGAVSDDGSV